MLLQHLECAFVVALRSGRRLTIPANGLYLEQFAGLVLFCDETTGEPVRRFFAADVARVYHVAPLS